MSKIVPTANQVEPVTPATWEIHPEERQEIVRQIGRMNLLSISGGRVKALRDGIELPVNAGYHVQVILTPADEYVVRRVFRRGGKEWERGRVDAWTGNVNQAAYYASCYVSYDAEEWPTKF